jgi:alpha-tubulin suppressor-like RCC1 family protein
MVYFTVFLFSQYSCKIWGNWDKDGDGIPRRTDCDDSDPSPFTMQELDTDCDGFVDAKYLSGYCGIGSDRSIQCWERETNILVQEIPTGNNFKQVTLGGGGHACALDDNNRVTCWGRDNYSQVTDTPTDNDFISISSGYSHNCAIKSDLSMTCWGDEIWEGATGLQNGSYSQVAGGLIHTCALNQEGKIRCRGEDGDTGRVKDAPKNVDFVQIGDGMLYSCALHRNGSIECWGGLYVGEFIEAVYPPQGNNFVQLSVGDLHSCAIDIDGKIHCWGEDNEGQSSNVPTEKFAVMVSALNDHTCAIFDDGSVECWGDFLPYPENYASYPFDPDFDNDGTNNSEDCDDGNPLAIDASKDSDCDGVPSDQDCDDQNPKASDITIDSDCDGTNTDIDCDDDNNLIVTSIHFDNDCDGFQDMEYLSIGLNHGCAVGIDQSIQCWGSYEQVVTNPPTTGYFMQISSGGGKYVENVLDSTLVYNYRHSCALDNSGSIHCWGDNLDGQCDEAPSGIFIQVSAGGHHTCAINENKEIECWGSNYYSQLSDIPMDNTFVQVSASDKHTCALAVDGTITCWGDDEDPQPYSESYLRTGRVEDTPTGSHFVQISTGQRHNCALKNIDYENSIECWGLDEHGVVSNPPSGRFVQISSGFDYSCAIDIHGTVQCWGSQNMLSDMPYNGSFLYVSAAHYNACAIESNGNIKCWGDDDLIVPPEDFLLYPF